MNFFTNTVPPFTVYVHWKGGCKGANGNTVSEAADAALKQMRAEMTAGEACEYCGTTEGLRKVRDGYCSSVPSEYICEVCFIGTDTGPSFDDLPVASVQP